MWEDIGTFALEVGKVTERSIKMKSVPLEKAMFEILEMACSNPVDDEWNEYMIETHCIMWKIIAKKVDGQWIIKMATGEPC